MFGFMCALLFHFYDRSSRSRRDAIRHLLTNEISVVEPRCRLRRQADHWPSASTPACARVYGIVKAPSTPVSESSLPPDRRGGPLSCPSPTLRPAPIDAPITTRTIVVPLGKVSNGPYRARA